MIKVENSYNNVNPANEDEKSMQMHGKGREQAYSSYIIPISD